MSPSEVLFAAVAEYIAAHRLPPSAEIEREEAFLDLCDAFDVAEKAQAGRAPPTPEVEAMEGPAG